MHLPRNFLLVLVATCSCLVAALVGCARARPTILARAELVKAAPAPQPLLGASPASQPAASLPTAAQVAPASAPASALARPLASASTQASTSMPSSAPAVDRRAELRRLVAAELTAPELSRLGVSLVVHELGDGAAPGRELIAVQADKTRVPASNAKLLTSVAALALLPAAHTFVTEVARRGSRVYLRGTGDPLLHERDLVALARALKARGVRSVRHVVVDDSYFGRQQLAPGFSQFLAGSSYRPTHGAINLEANAIKIAVSAPRGRRRPRVDVLPPSDYVKVKKLVRFARARRGKASTVRRVHVAMRPRGSILWLTISGVFGRQAKPFVSWRAVYDPSLNAGWALRRALQRQGVLVTGVVSRGRTPAGARVLARRAHSLAAVLQVTNRDSHNLAAETLIRTIGKLGGASARGRGNEWPTGLARATLALRKLGLRDVHLYNGSGLHRGTKVSAADVVRLLEAVWAKPAWRRRLVPTLAVAGRSGTLGGRMRGTAAMGVVHAKTGTLGSVLALSGLVLPHGEPASQSAAKGAVPPLARAAGSRHPLAFSLLVNGSARRLVRRRMDRIAVLLARYARGEALVERDPTPALPDVVVPPPTDRPAHEGASKLKGPKQPKIDRPVGLARASTTSSVKPSATLQRATVGPASSTGSTSSTSSTAVAPIHPLPAPP